MLPFHLPPFGFFPALVEWIVQDPEGPSASSRYASGTFLIGGQFLKLDERKLPRASSDVRKKERTRSEATRRNHFRWCTSGRDVSLCFSLCFSFYSFRFVVELISSWWLVFDGTVEQRTISRNVYKFIENVQCIVLVLRGRRQFYLFVWFHTDSISLAICLFLNLLND